MQYVLEHISEDDEFRNILNNENAMEMSPLQNENFEGDDTCFDEYIF